MKKTDTTAGSRPTLPQLVTGLGRDSAHLVQQEIALAKAEIREGVATLLRGLAFVTAGGALALVAAFVLLDALVRGLTSLLALGMSIGIAVWLAPLLVALVFGSIGALVIRRGRSALDGASLTPAQTVTTLKEAREWLKTRAS